jgi:multiple sugar transport system substrate-binding protein
MKKKFALRSGLAASVAAVAVAAAVLPAVAASASSVTNITVWGSGGDQSTEVNGIQYAVNAFNKQYAGKYHASLTFVPNITTVQETATAADEGTVMEGDGPTLSYLAYSGKLADLTGYVKPSVVAEQSKYIQGQDTYNGKLYGMATINGTLNMYGNKALLAEAGITSCGTGPTTSSCYPSDWANAWTATQFGQVLQKLKANSSIDKLDGGYVWGANVNYGGEYEAYGFLPILNSAGSPVVSGNTANVLKTNAVYTALEQVSNWMPLNDQTSNGNGTAFVAGDEPLLWGGHWQLPSMQSGPVTNDGKDLGNVVGIPLPNFGWGAKDGAGSNVWEVSSAASTAQKQAAGAFLDYVASPSFQVLYTYGNGTMKNGAAVYGDGAIPADPAAVAKDPTVEPGGVLYNAAQAEVNACPANKILRSCFAVPRPVTPAYPGIDEAVSTMFNSLFAASATAPVSLSTVKSLVATAVDSINSYYQQFNDFK